MYLVVNSFVRIFFLLYFVYYLAFRGPSTFSVYLASIFEFQNCRNVHPLLKMNFPFIDKANISFLTNFPSISYLFSHNYKW